MKLRDAFVDWQNALRYEQGVTPKSLGSYRPRLRAFLEWLEANVAHAPTPSDLTTPLLRRYAYSLSEKGNRPRTVRAHFDALRSFCRFLIEAGVLTENPTATIKLPKMDAAIRREVRDSEVAAMFEACERLRTLRQCAMARAVLSVCCYGGLRRDEICSLLVEDVSVEEQSVLIRSGKGRKSRKVFLCKDGIEALQNWLSTREKNTKTDYLFTVDIGRRLHYRGLAALLGSIKAAAGMRGEQDLTPHCLRHWAATNLLRNGATLRDVQAFLGHSNAVITARYLHADEERLRTISEWTALRSNPVELSPGSRSRNPSRQEKRGRPRRIVP